MKKDGKFRFSLQFGTTTESDRRAGEFLEKLGNKKSAVIVAALNDYLDRRPELLSSYSKMIRVERVSFISREDLECIIQRIVKDQIAQVSSGPVRSTGADNEDNVREDIARMLENLELFK